MSKERCSGPSLPLPFPQRWPWEGKWGQVITRPNSRDQLLIDVGMYQGRECVVGNKGGWGWNYSEEAFALERFQVR